MEILRNLSHHAYCFTGNSSLGDEIVSALAELHGIQTKANADFSYNKYDIFSIDDVRQLKSSALIMPADPESKKIFIIAMNGLTVEAQNAMLKLFEEPPVYSHFFLVIPSLHLLLPTVKSRMFIVEGDKSGNSEYQKSADDFLNMKIPKRLEFVKKLTDEISKGKKSKSEMVSFLNSLEKAVYEKGGVKEGSEALKSISLAKKYAGDRSPSLKMLLEYVAMVVD